MQANPQIPCAPPPEPLPPSPWNPSLEESTRAARRALEAKIPVYLRHWKAVLRQWREAKGHLVQALDPATGRTILPVRHDPSPEERADQFRGVLTAQVATRYSIPSLPDGTPAPAAQALLSLRDLSAALLSSEIAQGRIDRASDVSARCESVRRGMTLSRALGAWLRAHGMTADEASRCVERVSIAAQVTPRQGWVVLSAAPWDILTCSEGACYSSCHGWNGCHAAGPQSYLADDVTLTLFYFEELRDLAGYAAPFKLGRQMVYVDSKHGSAALQRRYGQELPPAFWAAGRRLVAELLWRMAGKDGEPHWWRSNRSEEVRVEEAEDNLAYRDDTCEAVQLTRGLRGRPRVVIGGPAPCAGCGGVLDSADTLVCSDCAGGQHCAHCGERVGEDDGHCVDGDDAIYCDSCYSELYSYCERCCHDCPADDVEDVCGRSLCMRCARREHTRCAACGEWCPDDDAVCGYCPDCADDYVSRCRDCEDDVDNDQMIAGRCHCCARKHAGRLAERLQHSPRWRRNHPAARYLLGALWMERDAVPAVAHPARYLLSLVS